MAVDPKKLDDLSAYLDGFKMATFHYDLATTLMELRGNTELIEHHGCKSFWELMDKTGIRARRARYLINIVERLNALGYTEGEMRELFDTFKWTKLSPMAKHLKKRIALRTLKKDFGGLTTENLKGKLKGKRTVQFTAQITKAQKDKLISYLDKKYGIEKGKGHGKVGKPFGKLIDALKA